MRYAPLTVVAVVVATLGAFLLANPRATAQEASGLDGVKKASLVLENGERESGKIRFVNIGSETFVHVSRGKTARYVNLSQVTFIIPN